ncbi:MAG: hypothetical protein ACI89J_002732 [Hyphomicrobiaceae bacterium]|jgi:uncharacterized protein (DUF924 family)
MSWFDEFVKLSAAGSSGQDALSDNWSADVLGFWFSELTPADWFKKSDITDAAIGERFLQTYASISQLAADALCGSSDQALGAVIVLDQFPRNLFRGNAQSFKADPLARQLAEMAIAAGFDRDMTVDQRVFLYLPFEHSEDMADQDRSVELMSALGNDNYTSYAIAHRDVIAKFGRFPHRNAVLARASTSAEENYLAQPGSGF